MSRFVVSSRGQAPITVDAANWITALGHGLDAYGEADRIDRLACEVLPNGTVIARDARSGSGYVIQPMGLRREPRVSMDADEEHTVLMMEAGPDDALSDEHGPIEAPSASLLLAEDEDTDAIDVTLAQDVLDRVREARSPTTAWQVALEVSQQLVPAEAGAALRREDDGALRFVGASGPHARQLLAMALPPGTGVVGFCVDRSTSVVVRNPYSDPRFFQGVDKATGFNTRAILAAPVRDGDGVLGCIELLNPPGADGFSRGALDIVEHITRILAQRLLADD